jgi:hypothetical protein
MATYSVKLVDHRNTSDNVTAAIASSIAHSLNLAFNGTNDRVGVSWGDGSPSDNLVIHFVEDIANSYLRRTWGNVDINPQAGGHTHSHGSLSGTELYRITPRGKVHVRRYGGLAFHEALHNLFPFRNDVHTAFGGGLASAIVPDMEPNDTNKDFLRQGFSVRNPQLL